MTPRFVNSNKGMELTFTGMENQLNLGLEHTPLPSFLPMSCDLISGDNL